MVIEENDFRLIPINDSCPQYDLELFDCLAGIVHGQKRSIEEIEASLHQK